MTAPIASGGSDFAGWALHPLESAALSQRTPAADLALSLKRKSAWMLPSRSYSIILSALS